MPKSGGNRHRKMSSAVMQAIAKRPQGEFSFLCQWRERESGAHTLERIAVSVAAGELSLTLENSGKKV